MCKKEREICEFEMILRNLFCVLVWLILYISLYFLKNTNIIGIGWLFCWRSNLSNDEHFLKAPAYRPGLKSGVENDIFCLK